jgi:hypothetical protein
MLHPLPKNVFSSRLVSILCHPIQTGESSVSSMGSDRLKVRMTVGFGTSAVLALRPTAPTYGERREQFETYHEARATGIESQVATRRTEQCLRDPESSMGLGKKKTMVNEWTNSQSLP